MKIIVKGYWDKHFYTKELPEDPHLPISDSGDSLVAFNPQSSRFYLQVDLVIYDFDNNIKIYQFPIKFTKQAELLERYGFTKTRKQGQE